MFGIAGDYVIFALPGIPAKQTEACHNGSEYREDDIPEHLGIEHGLVGGGGSRYFFASLTGHHINSRYSECNPDESGKAL